jgi:hypothetical protein
VDRAGYQRYIDSYDARDYDAVPAHYADRFELVFADYVFRTADEVRRLNTFLHSYIMKVSPCAP